jgi:hypothetical protein
LGTCSLYICIYIILLMLVLGLYSTYEKKYVAFVFLNMAKFT